MSDTGNTRLAQLWSELRAYLDLNIEYAKLTTAEKTALLLSAMAISVVFGVLAVLIFFFISLATIHWLAQVISVAMSYTIMAGVYVALLVVILVCRKQIIVNPITKFITKLILK